METCDYSLTLHDPNARVHFQNWMTNYVGQAPSNGAIVPFQCHIPSVAPTVGDGDNNNMPAPAPMGGGNNCLANEAFGFWEPTHGQMGV